MNIVDLFFPKRCPFCSARLDAAGEIEGICRECAVKTVKRGRPDVLPHGALKNVLRLYVPLYYAGPAKQAMSRYKFRGESWLAEPFAAILFNYLDSCCAFRDTDVITCVPVSGRRFAERGYDQSRLVAEKVAELAGKPFRKLLERSDDAVTSEANLAERMALRRFSLSSGVIRLSGVRVLLIDDIFTTGSTLCECASLLLSGGAVYVNAACLMSGRQDIFEEKERSA